MQTERQYAKVISKDLAKSGDVRNLAPTSLAILTLAVVKVDVGVTTSMTERFHSHHRVQKRRFWLREVYNMLMLHKYRTALWALKNAVFAP
jgi:hypothetical protein